MERQQLEALRGYIDEALAAAESDDAVHSLRNAKQIVEMQLELLDD
jgi:hypothetical protein